MFVDICKEKINVFPEGTLFANACTSARIGQRCCYGFAACTQFFNACVSAYTEANFAKYVLP
jgi:hypothetical protein